MASDLHTDDDGEDVGDLDADDIVAQLAAPTDWRTLDAEHAPQQWAQLRDWVHWLVARYQLDPRLVPPCWYLHPSLVDLLTALRDYHRGAHHRLAPTSAPLGWQLALAQCEPRLRDWVARSGCTRDQHRDQPPAAWPDDGEPWRVHVAADTRARHR